MITLQTLKAPLTPAQCEQLLVLYKAANWWGGEEGDAHPLINLLVNGSLCFAIALDGDRIIGMGRCLSDGISDGYIQDVTVHPDYRKQGIGGKIVRHLVESIQAGGIGWIGLISEPGYENFYRELGFKEMPHYTPFIYKPDTETDK